MTNFKPLPVGEAGRRYVLTLTERIPGLCAALSPSVASGGECYGIVAEGVSLVQALDFEGSPGTGDCCTDGWLTQRLASLSQGGRSGVLIVQDLWFKPEDHQGDPPPQTEFWFHDDEVYFWQEFGSNCSPNLDLLFRQPNSFNVVAFLVGDPNVAAALRAGTAEIAQIAEDVTEVYALAYDQESFVMWVR